MSFSFIQYSVSYLKGAQKRVNYLPLCSFTYLNTARASPFSLLARLLPFNQPCLILHALPQFCLHIPVKHLLLSAAVWHCWFRQPDIMCKLLHAYSLASLSDLVLNQSIFSIQAWHFTFCFPNCSPFPSFQTSAPTCQDHFELSPCLPAFLKLDCRSEFNKHALSFISLVIEENSEYCCPQERSIQYPTSNAMLHHWELLFLYGFAPSFVPTWFLFHKLSYKEILQNTGRKPYEVRMYCISASPDSQDLLLCPWKYKEWFEMICHEDICVNCSSSPFHLWEDQK